jgi:endoglucanase
MYNHQPFEVKMKPILKRTLCLFIIAVIGVCAILPAAAADTAERQIRNVTVGKTFFITVPNPDNLDVQWYISDKTIVKATIVKDETDMARVTPLKAGEFYIRAVVGEKSYKGYYKAENPATTPEAAPETTPPTDITEPESPSTDTAFLTAKEIVADMKVGINLGNTFDARDINWIQNPTIAQMETAWLGDIGKTAKKGLIDAYVAAGIDVLRIPVSWHKALESDNLTIRADWMKRVREVLDWAYDAGMYVILNSHHDDDYFSLFDKDFEQTKIRFEKIWSQIATEFKDYSDHLIFECLNEPRAVGTPQEWSTGVEETRENLNTLLQIFVDTVRKFGGNNDKRTLMVMGNSAGPDGMPYIILPEDDNLIVSMHAYLPWSFAGEGIPNSTWSASKSSDTGVIDNAMNRAYDLFVSKGIPVIIGEYGALTTGNKLEDREAWLKYYLNAAEAKGIPCIWWDTGSFINRSTFEWLQPSMLKILQDYTK